MGKCLSYEDGLCTDEHSPHYQRLCDFSRNCFKDSLDDLPSEPARAEKSNSEKIELCRLWKGVK